MGLQHRILFILGLFHIVPFVANELREENPPNMEGCGISKTSYSGAKIVGGRQALDGELPWQLSLEMQLVPFFSDFQHICGASVIDKKWAVTAAHCIAGGPLTKYRIVAGTQNITTRITPRKSSVLPVVHEGYNPVKSLKNDIAMLRITTPLDMESSEGYINGVCLPPPSFAGKAEGIATVSGWGTTSQGGNLSSVLLAVDVPIVTREKCREAYGDMIEDTMLCAGYEEGGKDSCQGDSGGPLVQKSDGGVSNLIGIVSWGRGCAQPGYPGVYTETASYIDWITRTMQIDVTQSETNRSLADVYYQLIR